MVMPSEPTDVASRAQIYNWSSLPHGACSALLDAEALGIAPVELSARFSTNGHRHPDGRLGRRRCGAPPASGVSATSRSTASAPSATASGARMSDWSPLVDREARPGPGRGLPHRFKVPLEATVCQSDPRSTPTDR
jgi:hypothetical protein